MSGVGQFKRGTTTQWTNANPVLAVGELGVDLTLNIFKIGDGITHWSGLPVANLGATGPAGPTGATGTGLSRTTSSTIDFGVNDDTYVEKTITDALITSSSTIIVQPLGEDYALQEVTCGVVSISNGVNYTIFAKAPNGASGVMNINVLIF